MAYSESVKAEVRAAFIRGQPLKGAAQLKGVPYETARAWKRRSKDEGDCWDTARAANHISAGGIKALTSEIIEDFVHLFKSTIDEIKNAENMQASQKAEAIARLSDSYQKTVKAAGMSNPELSRLAIAMDVLQRQAEYIRRKAPHMQEAFLLILEPFSKELSRVYG